ncbi:MAG: oligosaccharide flippase family protein [Polyangiaceae bacterium]
MSIERKAARGVAWNMATGIGTRVVGLVGTLVLTRFISPAEYGEVSAASICVQSASVLLSFAFGQYLIANKSSGEVAFQAFVMNVVLGAVAMAAVFVLRGPLGVMLDAPAMGTFVAGYAVATMLDRARLIPQAVLARALRFRAVAIISSIGELTFTGTALALAWRWGPYAIMVGSMARAALIFILFAATAPRAEWLKPARMEKAVAKQLVGYGAPLMLSIVADRAASTWDNLIMMRLFGAKVMGTYALSYSLAETPLIYVAERMGDVLMPAFSKMEPAERPAAVVRAAGLMSLVVAPLGVGLGSIAPTIVKVFFDARWAGMSSILMTLSVMTVFQPVAWSALAYLQTERTTRPVMAMSVMRATSLLGMVALLGWLGGPVWACAGVGAAFALHSVFTVVVTARFTALSARQYFGAVIRPLLACVPMFVAVAALRTFLAQRHVPGAVSLAAEVVGGAVVYLGAALALAGTNVGELVRLLRPAATPAEDHSL